MAHIWTTIVAAATVAVLAAGAGADTITWTDTTPGGATWHDDGNWDAAQPGAGDTAVLANGGKAIATANVTIENLQLKGGSTWRIESGDTLVSITGHDKVKLADSGGVSTIEMTGGMVEFMAGAMFLGRGSGNGIYGRFAGGTLIHKQAPGAYADMRIASSNGASMDIELSGTATWDMYDVSIGYHTSVPAPSTFTMKDSAVLNARRLLVDDSTVFTVEGSAQINATSDLIVGGVGADRARFVVTSGTVTSGKMSVGDDGEVIFRGGTVSTGAWIPSGIDPVITVEGGTVTGGGLQIGLQAAGQTGTVKIVNGTTLSMPGKLLYVGRWGHGSLLLGDATSSGALVGGLLIFDDQNRGGTGLVQGWGRLDATGLRFMGSNTARIIADGYGADRTLTVTRIVDRHDQHAVDTDSGWYAQNGGKLALPTISVGAGASTEFWGELASLAQPDLVNSVMLQFSGVAGGDLAIALLAADRAEFADTVATGAVGFWEFDSSAFDFGGGTVDLTFRYDDAAAGAGEADLKLYKTDANGDWVLLNYTLDTANNLITATGVDAFSHFGIGEEITNASNGGPAGAIPEPATLLLLGLGGPAVLRRRLAQALRRRK